MVIVWWNWCGNLAGHVLDELDVIDVFNGPPAQTEWPTMHVIGVENKEMYLANVADAVVALICEVESEFVLCVKAG